MNSWLVGWSVLHACLGTACSAKHIKILVAAFFRCIISKGSTDVATHIEVYLLFNTSVRESEIQ